MLDRVTRAVHPSDRQVRLELEKWTQCLCICAHIYPVLPVHSLLQFACKQAAGRVLYPHLHGAGSTCHA